jgi:hypothetical protein
MTVAQRPPKRPQPSTWITAPAAGVVVGVSAFCLLAIGNGPDPEPPEPPAEVEAPAPEEAPAWADAIPAAEDDTGCQVSVQATLDGRPADAARLSLHRVGQSSTVSTWSAVPRADGVHRFAGLPTGTYHLVAEAEGRAPVAAQTWTCGAEGERAFFALTLDEVGAPFEGKVTGRGGVVADGTELMIEQPDGFRAAHPGVVHLSVDGDGSFATRLAPGRYTLLALAPHHTPIRQELTIDDNGGKTRLRLAWRPEARGVVYDEAGAPVAGATVYLGPHFDPKVPPSMATTEEDGSFVLAVLPGQNITLTAKTNAGVGHVSLPEVSKVEGHTGVSIQLDAGRTVTGWLEHRDGKPVPFGEVTYRIKELGMVGVVKAKDDGTFALAGVPASADVELWPKNGAIGAWGGAVASPGRDRVLLTYVPPAY